MIEAIIDGKKVAINEELGIVSAVVKHMQKSYQQEGKSTESLKKDIIAYTAAIKYGSSGQNYISIYDTKGVAISNLGNPQFNGQSGINAADVNGVKYIEKLVNSDEFVFKRADGKCD